MAQQKSNSGEKSHLLDDLIMNAQIAWRLMIDPRVSLITKALVPALGLIYVLSPIDLIPEVIPVLGQLDDLAVILLLVRLFISLAPPTVVAEHRSSMGGGQSGHSTAGPQPGASGTGASQANQGDFVDAEYRVVDD